MAMADKIKLFQFVRKSYAAIGLDLNPCNPTAKNRRQRIFIACSLLQTCISSTAFLVFKANTVQDYATSFYISLSLLFVLVIFFSLGPKMGDISKQYVMYEEFIARSEWNCVQLPKKRRIFLHISIFSNRM